MIENDFDKMKRQPSKTLQIEICTGARAPLLAHTVPAAADGPAEPVDQGHAGAAAAR